MRIDVARSCGRNCDEGGKSGEEGRHFWGGAGNEPGQ